jgi:hypothetical protein
VDLFPGNFLLKSNEFQVKYFFFDIFFLRRCTYKTSKDKTFSSCRRFVIVDVLTCRSFIHRRFVFNFLLCRRFVYRSFVCAPLVFVGLRRNERCSYKKTDSKIVIKVPQHFCYRLTGILRDNSGSKYKLLRML